MPPEPAVPDPSPPTAETRRRRAIPADLLAIEDTDTCCATDTAVVDPARRMLDPSLC